jgi:coenzyme PQQ precursor peptide PqqA
LDLDGPIGRPYDRRAQVTIQGVRAMIWETPSFEEVKMDAEINSYQDDLS